MANTDVAVNVPFYGKDDTLPTITKDGQLLDHNGIIKKSSVLQNKWVPVNNTDAVNAQTGTTYTFVADDANRIVTMTNGSASTITIPANASVAFPIGTVLTAYQMGAGKLTLAVTSDTGNAIASQLSAPARYGGLRATKLTSTTWIIDGIGGTTIA